MADAECGWSDQYSEMISRNIGLLTLEQQERLRSSKAAVLGVGGLGGTIFEVLVRSGVGRFAIVDRDAFDPTNMNRQIFANRQTLGKRKIDVAAEWARAVNTDVELDAFDRVGEDNIDDILQGADVAILAIDSLAPCVIASRKCRQLGIPLVEGWALPYENVRVYTRDTPTLEESYGLPTQGRQIADIPDEEFRTIQTALLLGLGKIEGVRDFYPDAAIQKIRQGHITSFAPMVWLTAVLMATEAIKVLLNWGRLALAPDFALYDPFQHRIPRVSGLLRFTHGAGI